MAAPALDIPVARFTKALRLADLLDAAHLGAAEIEAMGAHEWRLLADAARTRVPSPDTRGLVLQFLQNRETARAAFTRNASV